MTNLVRSLFKKNQGTQRFSSFSSFQFGRVMSTYFPKEGEIARESGSWWMRPGNRSANLIRDRQLLEAAKREAAFVVTGPNAELSKQEIDRALKTMRSRWSLGYGLAEVG
ncbi:MAG: hypothetical protein ACRD3Q_06630 [Terriglobales bacterium]